MERLGSFTLSALDHATRLDLITKVHTVAEAELCFENLTSSTSRKAASYPLLHHYVKERNMEKAEAFMVRLQNAGLAVNPHLFNEMMKLYMAVGQFEKVCVVIQLMKQGKIPLNALSYNLWMNACSEVSGVASVEMVQKEMISDNNIELGWSTYVTLANIYTKSGVFGKAITSLRMAEEKLSVKNRLAYSFVMTSYAVLRDRDGVVRTWESSKRVPGRISCVNYMCIMSCLLKVGDIGEAEKVFGTWESQCRKYDVRVSNVLLGAYVRNGLIDRAEFLHFHTLERGGSPNYKTWEILMEGWVKTKQMDKAVKAMKRAFSLLKHCNWRPSSDIVMAISDYFEEKGSVVGSRRYMKVLQQLNLTSLPLYKSFLRVHINAKKSTPNILKMMARDKIDMDEETNELIQHASRVSCADV